MNELDKMDKPIEELTSFLTSKRFDYEYIVSVSLKLWDKEIAHKIVYYAVELLREGYLQKPHALIGKSRNVLIGCVLYVSGIRRDERRTQKLIAVAVGVSEVSINKQYKLFSEVKNT
jgi:transcription initiation factor TFIIIB Brf1 subunit/transcription initiation factor TFIIB